MILSALRLSLLVSALATALVAVAGTWAGWTLARREFRGRELVDALLNLPLVLPPTVTGYYLIVLLGRHGLLGGPVYEATGWSVTFTWAACVIAGAVMAFPLMVRSARVAFEQLDRRHEIAAASLGHGRLSTFMRISLPLARRGLAAGVILAAARSLGEFGATLMIAGNIPGRTQTLPLAIYDAVISGEDRAALWLALLLTAVSVVVMIGAGRLGRGARRRW
jgi:molybdate transport system permease protein